ncbi:MAG: DUF5661 family protein [Pseudomonadota bacterium]|nr:hypothetical protein [Desulfobacterales bacterium]MBL6968031.1 hypothetical protein [Desulfobacteraceae bacterium]MBL7171893.1 hypothetical protein [Desulfobacteraceae bacterium]MBU0990125.1 hypothetical protein [Pseudomonadota bacterium]
MKIPKYVTVEEVKRVCKELNVSDWTQKKAPKVSLKEAKIILAEVSKGKMEIDPKAFQSGLEVELEHGLQYKDANVTNNHPLLTGLIVLAHLKESLDYYTLLDVAELEGDLLKAVVRGQSKKIKVYYQRLAEARIALRKAELSRLA